MIKLKSLFIEAYYNQGYEAFNNGSYRCSNPYPYLSHERQLWFEGWDDGLRNE